MSPRAATVLPLILIAACAAAFLRAEQLKLRHSAVGHPHVRQSFSPGCTEPRCRPQARMRFMLRSPQRLTLSMVSDGGAVVRRLAGPRPYPVGPVRVTWDGTSGRGSVVPDGRYELRVTLASGRDVTIPDPVVVDTVPPSVVVHSVRRGGSSYVVRYTRSGGSGHTELIALRGGEPVYHKRCVSRACRLPFSALPSGRYRVQLVGVDTAGNRPAQPPSFMATIP